MRYENNLVDIMIDVGEVNMETNGSGGEQTLDDMTGSSYDTVISEY
jgi:hypothetical protein